MWSRTRGVAVAVSASDLRIAEPRGARPSRRYAGRKSWPHSEMQCASSTHRSHGGAFSRSAAARRATPASPAW